MSDSKTVFFVLGPSYYGEWAKDFSNALSKASGVEVHLIYTNTLVGLDLGKVKSVSTGLVNKAKETLRRYSPGLVESIKGILRGRAESALVKEVDRIAKTGVPVVVLFTWTPPKLSILKRLKKTSARLVMWQGEAPCRDASWADSFPYFEHIFILDKSWYAFMDESLHARTSVLRLASSPERYHPCDKDPKLECDVALVSLYRRERAQTISVLKDYDLRIYGYNWEQGFDEFPWLRDKYRGRITAEEVNAVFNSAKIVIGTFGMGVPNFPGHTITQRTYDIPLAGNFQIGDYIPATIETFGDSIVMFKDQNDLKAKVDHYLDHPEERKMLADKAHAIGMAKHTYANRVEEMLEVLKINK